MKSLPESAAGAPSQMAGLVEIPVIVRDVDDKTALEIAIVENVQRADLNRAGRSAGL
jgi:ParB family chromosome partitioning protein